ncbi:MAG TPA: immunoglobulin-like domain-containing protein [Clostridia bacterium]|nr:immunoglobulin-like domain-containing protein [Clostridia bacterium]
MYNSLLKRIVSVLLLTVFSVSQLMPVYGRSSSVPFSSAGQYASTGKLNCFPEAGSWIYGYSPFYWEYNSKSGDEIKPSDGNASFTYGWNIPLTGSIDQIKDGLKYSINLEVFGQMLDGDAARILVDFLVPHEEGRGYVTYEFYQENIDMWQKMNISGYVPENAEAMTLRFGGIKALGFLADDDCAIYYRNIEIYFTDDIPPAPRSVEYGERRELRGQESSMKDYYGLGDNVYLDIEFNEPVFVNDPGYLAYVRGLGSNERNSFLNDKLKVKYPYDELALAHVQDNDGRAMLPQFGELKLKFKYKNADGADKTAYAYPVDKSGYNPNTYGNDYSKQIKFKYTIRPGDEFQASDIYEMAMEGGAITDNAFNPIPNDSRTISFDSSSGSGARNVYRSYTQDFKVETTAPVLLEINGGRPEGPLGSSEKLPLYFKFSEPVYITISDEAFTEHNINKSEFEDKQRRGVFSTYDAVLTLNVQSLPNAYYVRGNGTSMLEFEFYNQENSFDPLEIIGSEYSDWKDEEGESKDRVSYGELYVMDAAGNKAPLLQDKTVKLSDKKRYITNTDLEPPEIAAQVMKAGDGKDGFYLIIDVTDEGSGVDYDNLYFIFGYPGSMGNKKLLVPGRKYHSEELGEMFGVDPYKEDTYRILVLARDKSGNRHYIPDTGKGIWGEGWYTDISSDSAAFTLVSCDVDKQKYSSNHGHFNALIEYGSSKALDVKYKWVSAGFNPDTEDWLQAHSYIAGAGQYYASGPGPSVYIYGDADLYLKAVGAGGSEAVFCVPKALEYKDLYYVEGDVEFSFTGQFYYCKAQRFASRGSGVVKPIKGLWYCLSEEGTAPEFPGTSGLWKYKEGDEAWAFEYDENPRERKGWYFMHVIAVDDSGKPIGQATSPDMMFYNFDKGKIDVEAERLEDGSIVVRPTIISEYIRRQEYKVEYDINNHYGTHAWKSLPDTGEIVIGRELQNPRAELDIRAIGPGGEEITYNADFGDGTGGMRTPGVLVNLSHRYNDKAYTNENFAELIVDTEADEFSYSLDGTTWSNWIPVEKKKLKTEYGNAMLYVPLPDKEGEITFYTKYRRDTGQSDVVKSSVIRDVTPPTGKVEYSSYNGSDFWFNAKLKDLSDNLCPAEAIEIIGDKSKIIAAGTPEYFMIKDVAGNLAEVKAYKSEVPPKVINEDNDKSDDGGSSDNTAPVIDVSPDGSTGISVKETSVQITVTGRSSISKILYAFSTDIDPSSISEAGWTEIANNSTVNLAGMTGNYYLHVKATDAIGNTGIFRSETYYMDNEAPEITIDPDGEAGKRTSISPRISVGDDHSISELLYAFSDKSDWAEIGESDWTEIDHNPGGNTVSLSGVTGTYYLYAKATDEAGNTAEKRSDSYNMVNEYTEPYAVFSGELYGVMKAYIASPDPITVTKAVYGGITYESPGYVFNYKDNDEINRSMEGEFDGWRLAMDLYKGTVSMDPDNKVTSGNVKVTLSAPTDIPVGARHDVYGDYDDVLEFRFYDSAHAGEAGILNEKLISEVISGEVVPGEAGSIKILEGFIGTFDYGTGKYIVGTDLPGEFITDELLENEDLVIFSAEVTVKENGLIAYYVDDGDFRIKIGHIVSPEEEGNVDVTALNGRWTAYAPWTLLASASKYAGMLGAEGSLSGADLTPPVGKVTYTSADQKKGPVTADLKLSDDRSGKLTITNNGGSSRYVFDKNGQFVFEFVDEAGNRGRALAETGTIMSSAKVRVSYSTKLPIKGNVKVTMKPEAGVTLKSGDVQTVQEGGVYTFNAADNGQWEFIFVNEAGIEEKVIASVTNIDKTPPKLYIDYIKNTYNKTITAFVRSDEPIWVSNIGNRVHVFREAGQYIMKAEDEAGNEAVITAAVTEKDLEALGIYKSNINVNIGYSTKALTNKPVRLTLTSDKAFTVLNNNGNKDKEVIKNGKYQFVVKDDLNMIKIVEAEVNNIDTEAPVITLGYPENPTFMLGDTVNVMNFTAVDNFDGDITKKVKVEGSVNTRQPGYYPVTYRVSDNCGNTAAKALNVKILSSEEPEVSINGIKYESEPLIFKTGKLLVSTRGFAGKVSIKWTEGYEAAAFFKDGGTIAAGDTVTVSEDGWYTLYIYDNERNSRIIHVLITDLGGEQ